MMALCLLKTHNKVTNSIKALTINHIRGKIIYCTVVDTVTIKEHVIFEFLKGFFFKMIDDFDE